MDNVGFWFDIINKAQGNNVSESEDVIHLLIGEDLGLEFLEPCGFVYHGYQAGPHRGILGVVGPARFRYQNIVPVVNYFADMISTITR